MLEFVFLFFTIYVFTRILLFGLKMAWGIGKLLITVVLLPFIILLAFFKISIYLAWPLLAIVAITSIFVCH